MGRIRKTARFVFSVGGYDGFSPIRRESSAETAARTTHALLTEQNRLLRGEVPQRARTWEEFVMQWNQEQANTQREDQTEAQT